MYDDYDEPRNAVQVDERERLMSEYVSLDRQLCEMHEQRRSVDETIDKASAKQREIRSRLADALGFANNASDEKAKAALREAMSR